MEKLIVTTLSKIELQVLILEGVQAALKMDQLQVERAAISTLKKRKSTNEKGKNRTRFLDLLPFEFQELVINEVKELISDENKPKATDSEVQELIANWAAKK
ncbi:MAG: hypothetical protein KAF40_04035 [Flavihumibacter sp.]|nr:hypothetical protein [Flavihumibacter sp.]